MVVIKGVNAKSILDSRKEKTISVTIKTNVGVFTSSAPNGKSTGKREAKSYKKNLDGDIKTLKQFSDYFSEDNLEKFDDLRRVEDIVDGHVGGNTILALEYATLKAIAKEQKCQVWQLIISSHDFFEKSKKPKFPRLVGNAIGGGKHSEDNKKFSKSIKEGFGILNQNKKPDFQEFLVIPKSTKVLKSFEINKKTKKELEVSLKKEDKKFNSKKNDENAWKTSLNEKEVLDILKKLKSSIGLDVAASSFFKRKKYLYNNPMLKRDKVEQLGYLSNLIKNYNLFYIEDPFNEDDFESFSKLLKKFPDSLIVGDDLTVTNSKILEKAIEMKSINAIIVKPNQCGSLLEVKRVCELAKKNNIKIVFSHRSGETTESILADLAFGFQADFFKCGITGKEREAKLKRLVEIEKSFK